MESSSGDFKHIGSELELFAEAVNWRAYWQRQAVSFLGRRGLRHRHPRSLPPTGRALGGARTGSRHGRLFGGGQADRSPAGDVGAATRHQRDAGPEERFDTAFYIDVLVHIEDDQTEVARVGQHLTPGGHLVVLAPAHQALYTPFDAASGHFRRYGIARLLTVGSEGMRVCRARYLDSVGLFAVLGNRLPLRSAQPNRRQIGLWDRLMVHSSRRLDPLFGYRLGKSFLVVWRNP